MTENTFEEICPVCKAINTPGAIVCEKCGAILGELEEAPTTNRLQDDSIEPDPATISLVPNAGIGIYLENTVPITVMDDPEFILGRRTDGVLGPIVDLVPFGAFEQGVSRRHALVRETDDAYEIIDLDSTNGTWLDKLRLVPNKAYPLHSGAILRLGRMGLLVLYKPFGK